MLVGLGLRHFNSTLVRLRACSDRNKSISCTNFNSTLVRLRVFTDKEVRKIVTKFQFHIGAIKSVLG